MKFIYKLLITVCTFFLGYQTFAQTTDQTDKVEIVQADEARGSKIKNQDIKKLIGSVILRQKGTMMEIPDKLKCAEM